jgi:hypothetical protein
MGFDGPIEPMKEVFQLTGLDLPSFAPALFNGRNWVLRQQQQQQRQRPVGKRSPVSSRSQTAQKRQVWVLTAGVLPSTLMP